MYLHLIPIAWMYVALMMSAAEALAPNGSILGAIITFLFYGLLPVSLIWYFIGSSARRKAIRAREAAELEAAQAAAQQKADEKTLP